MAMAGFLDGAEAAVLSSETLEKRQRTGQDIQRERKEGRLSNRSGYGGSDGGNNNDRFFIAVHAGAGYHSPSSSREYCRVMRRACLRAASVFRRHSQGHSDGVRIQAVVSAIKVLEDDPLTNAGLGSNLTEEGTVECDASIMDGGRARVFGAVGAVGGVYNPIEVAAFLASESMKGLLPLGRVRPIFLAGDGARIWALRHGLKAAKNTEEAQGLLITPRAKKQWLYFQKLIKKASAAGEEEEEEKTTKMKNSSNLFSPDRDPVVDAGGMASINDRSIVDHHRSCLESRSLGKKRRRSKLPVEDEIPSADNKCNSEKDKGRPEEEKSRVEEKKSKLAMIDGGSAATSSWRFTEPENGRHERLCEKERWDGCSALFGDGDCDDDDNKDEEEGGEEDSYLMDTVGAIAIDCRGCISAGVSSGGIAMKVRGRVGEAAVHGCGCWSENSLESTGSSVGCSVSGVGEPIIKSSLAMDTCQAVRNSLDDVATPCEDALRKFLLRIKSDDDELRNRGGGGGGGGCTPNHAGVLLVVGDFLEGQGLDAAELVAVHTAPSFAIGYMASNMKVPRTIIALNGKVLEGSTSDIATFGTRVSFSHNKQTPR